MTSVPRSLLVLTLFGALFVHPRVGFTQPAASKPKVEAITIQQGLTTLKELIERPAPVGLSAADQAQWKSQTDWLNSVYQRLSVLKPRDASSGIASGRQASAGAVAEQKLAELKKVLDLESRRFQTLSNASRARQDAAKNAIQNLKA